MHSGVIDKPMYEYLLEADVAIADLSTSNENAIYELGVRHALRPRTTIILAENQFKFPFDLGHIVIRHYQHLGSGIDGEEMERVQGELKAAIETISAGNDVDSPVYTFLPDLVQPVRTAAMRATTGPAASAAPSAAAAPSVSADNPTLTVIHDAFRVARKEGDFILAKTYLKKLRENLKDDPYVIQQQALATYKSKHPNAVAALLEAKQILEALQPEKSGDVETLGLWGAIHKRLWEETHDRKALDVGVWAYERAFVMKLDHYTGINCAYMLDDRAGTQTDPAEATADHVLARRIRRRVLDFVDDGLRKMPRGSDGNVSAEDKYWLKATRVEAMMGLGDPQFATARDELFASAPEEWMRKTTEEQLGKLATRLGR